MENKIKKINKALSAKPSSSDAELIQKSRNSVRKLSEKILKVQKIKLSNFANEVFFLIFFNLLMNYLKKKQLDLNKEKLKLWFKKQMHEDEEVELIIPKVKDWIQ